MNKYEFKATNLIAEEFDKVEIKYGVDSFPGICCVKAGYYIDCGPNVTMLFISRDNDNDVAARIFGLVSSIPENKRDRAMRVCNDLSADNRYFKFYVNDDGDVNVEYDFPVLLPDEAVGRVAVETFSRAKKWINNEIYGSLMKALYSEENS